MNKEERKTIKRKIAFCILIIPIILLVFISAIITFPFWLIGKESYRETIPFKWTIDSIDWLIEDDIIW